MEEHDSWKNWRGYRAETITWTVCLLVAWMISMPALAHGDKGHEGTSPAIPQETAADDQTPTSGEPNADHSEPDAHDHQEHAHAGDDDHDTVPAEEVHDHSAHSPNEALLKSGFGRLLVWLGKFHPAVVHFPIAFLIAAAVAELLSLRFSPAFFGNAARFSLWVGALGAAVAAVLGWLYGGFRLTDEETVLTVHRWNGTAIALLALAALWLGERRVGLPRSWSDLYRAALVLTASLVVLNGYLGGLMVYGPEQHQWPEPPAEHAH